MGIFDFLKDMGKKADNEQNMAQSLRDSVSKAGLGIQDFRLEFDKGTATLHGMAATHKDLELARLIVGNHKGVEKVNDDDLRVAPQPVPSAQPAATPQAPRPTSTMPSRMVTVQSGDTLSKIAKQYLGDAQRYPEIFEANRPMLKDPDEIYPGQVLRIPS